MKKIIYHIICLLLFFAFISATATPLSALSFNGLPSISEAKCVYFYNLDAKETIVKKGSGTRIAPASATKIMTGLLACEMLEGRLDEEFTITQDMIRATEGTRMKLAEGDKLTIRSLLYGAVCGGFNDAAYALAFACADNTPNFVALMNEKAMALGASETKFATPTGYDTAGQYTTLEDIAKIAKAAAKNELYMEISGTVSKRVEFSNGKAPFDVHNRNGLISSYYAEGYRTPYAEGMIAGMTDLGGYSVITKAHINGSDYLLIVMGGNDNGGVISSYAIANELIDYAKAQLSERVLIKEGELICKIPVDFALDGAATENNEDYLNVRTATDVTALLENSVDESRITRRYHLFSERLSAPAKQGDVIGVIDVYLDGEHIASGPLIVNADVSANVFLIKMDKMKSDMLSRRTAIPLLLFFLFSTIYIFAIGRKKRKRVLEIKMKRYNTNNQKYTRGNQ